MANNVRFNPVTNDYDYYFPMEIRDPADKAYARLCGFEIDMGRIGRRRFLAVFVPCKDKIIDAAGREVFIDTPSDAQRIRYLEYCRDELHEQEAARMDGRCVIPGVRGGLRQCPRRVPNPDYVPGGDQPKTLPVLCEGCKYEPFRQEHTEIPASCLDHENEYGEMEPFDFPSPKCYMDGMDYDKLAALFVAYVREKKPKLADLAELLAQEYTRSEAARMLKIPLSTAGSRRDKLMEMCQDFLDNLIRLS